jgi:hypothetical protein
MVAMDPGLRRGDEALPSSDPPYYWEIIMTDRGANMAT